MFPLRGGARSRLTVAIRKDPAVIVGADHPARRAAVMKLQRAAAMRRLVRRRLVREQPVKEHRPARRPTLAIVHAALESSRKEEQVTLCQGKLRE